MITDFSEAKRAAIEADDQAADIARDRRRYGLDPGPARDGGGSTGGGGGGGDGGDGEDDGSDDDESTSDYGEGEDIPGNDSSRGEGESSTGIPHYRAGRKGKKKKLKGGRRLGRDSVEEEKLAAVKPREEGGQYEYEGKKDRATPEDQSKADSGQGSKSAPTAKPGTPPSGTVPVKRWIHHGDDDDVEEDDNEKPAESADRDSQRGVHEGHIDAVQREGRRNEQDMDVQWERERRPQTREGDVEDQDSERMADPDEVRRSRQDLLDRLDGGNKRKEGEGKEERQWEKAMQDEETDVEEGETDETPGPEGIRKDTKKAKKGPQYWLVNAEKKKDQESMETYTGQEADALDKSQTTVDKLIKRKKERQFHEYRNLPPPGEGGDAPLWGFSSVGQSKRQDIDTPSGKNTLKLEGRIEEQSESEDEKHATPREAEGKQTSHSPRESKSYGILPDRDLPVCKYANGQAIGRVMVP